jgi:type I restriction enzyme M protein
MTDKKADVSFIFEITNKVLWNVFKKNEIGDVLLPFVVLRRMDCILEPVNPKVRDAHTKFKDKVAEEKLTPILRKAAGGLQFYNTSKHTLSSLLENPRTVDIDFNNYLNGFNQEVRDIFENFQFSKVVARLLKNKLLYEMIDAICKVDLHVEKIDHHKMGLIFEELIRVSNEQSNETAGEHFTPRDVIELMCKVIFCTEKKELCQEGTIRTIYDPTLGTGGMVNLAKNYILDELLSTCKTPPTLRTYGQEINEQSYAIAKSEALITGEDASNIRHGNTLTEDMFPDKHFHYQLANPPYGVTWSRDQDAVVNESTNPAGRFYAGLPRTSDGTLLFIQHMLHKAERDNGKIAVVTNGSPLFTGSAGSGESDIRKHIISNDWLDCIIALPKDLFYNTGINTYIWFLTMRKAPNRRGKVQLINANVPEDKANSIAGFCRPEKRSMGNKRNRLYSDQIEELVKIYQAYEPGPYCKIMANDEFGYYRVTVERPLLNAKGKVTLDKSGNPKPDSSKRDTENIPLGEDIEAYFEREVIPHAPDAWIDHDKTRIGFDINFTKYFYENKTVRPSEDVKSEIKALGREIALKLEELFK